MQNLIKIFIRLRSTWYHLKPRERFLISLLLILSLLFGVIQFGILKNWQRIDVANSRITKLNKDFIKLNDLYKEYQVLKSRDISTGVFSRKGAGSILTIISNIIDKAQLKGNVRNINGPSTIVIKDKYKKKVVEIKIETVFVNQILEFLYKIENSPNSLFVEYFFIRDAYNKKGFYDFTLRISQFIKS